MATDTHSEIPDSKRDGLENLEKTTAFVVAVLSYVTAFAPLTGDHGVAGFILLPEHLAAVGRPFITLLAVAAVSIVIFEGSAGEYRRRTKYIGFFALIVGLTFLGMHLAWTAPQGLAYPKPFDAPIVSLVVAGLGIALVAAGEAVLAIGLAVKMPPVASVQLPAPRPSESRDAPLRRLLVLAGSGQWRVVLEEQGNHRGLLWRLYGALARLLCNPEQTRRDLRSARRALVLLHLVPPLWRSKSWRRDAHQALLLTARAMLPALTLRNETWRAIDALGSAPSDWAAAWDAYLQRVLFMTDVALPPCVGYQWCIDESQRAVADLLAFRTRMKPSQRSELLSMELKAHPIVQAQVSRILNPGLAGKHASHRFELLHALLNGDAEAVARVAYGAAAEFAGERYPEDSQMAQQTSYFAAAWYCLALGSQGEAKGLATVEALTYLTNRAVHFRLAEAAELALRLERIVPATNASAAAIERAAASIVRARSGQ